MGWTFLPVAAGQTVEAVQINELRAAIIERRRAVGMGPSTGAGDPPAVAAGSTAAAATINAYRSRIEGLFRYYLNPNAPAQRWTKALIMPAALGAGRTDWTETPPRAGTFVESAELPAGTVMYTEHLNEMRLVLQKLYAVPLEEKDGRQYAVDSGTGWQWSEEPSDPLVTAEARGNEKLGWPVIEKAESAPYDFEVMPAGAVTIERVRARGLMQGTNYDLRAKLANFAGHTNGPQPSDLSWKAQLRISNDRPALSPRGEDTTKFHEISLADDETHTADSKNQDNNILEVYIDDNWLPVTVPTPAGPEWPFWLTYVLEDYTATVNTWSLEAENSDRELADWAGSVYFTVRTIWAELDFEYE